MASLVKTCLTFTKQTVDRAIIFPNTTFPRVSAYYSLERCPYMDLEEANPKSFFSESWSKRAVGGSSSRPFGKTFCTRDMEIQWFFFHSLTLPEERERKKREALPPKIMAKKKRESIFLASRILLIIGVTFPALKTTLIGEYINHLWPCQTIKVKGFPHFCSWSKSLPTRQNCDLFRGRKQFTIALIRYFAKGINLYGIWFSSCRQTIDKYSWIVTGSFLLSPRYHYILIADMCFLF